MISKKATAMISLILEKRLIPNILKHSHWYIDKIVTSAMALDELPTYTLASIFDLRKAEEGSNKLRISDWRNTDADQIALQEVDFK